MKKKILALVLSALMLFALTACSASSSSSSTVTVSTSVSDENGTTTNTTTSEVGVSVGTDGIKTTHSSESSSTTTPDEGNTPEEIVEWWYDNYKSGAIGENANGDRFLLAYDDPEDISLATLTIISADGSSLYIREGHIEVEGEGEDEHLVLVDESRDVAVPFAFYDSEEGDFEMFFLGDDDVAVMNVVDQETILGEMQEILEATTAVEESNSAPAKKNGGAAGAANAGKKAAGYDAAKVRADWESVFTVGAEGRNEAGEYFLLAIDDPDDITYVAFMIMSADLKTLELYCLGEVMPAEGGGFVMVDDHSDMTVPFTLADTDEGFEMGFQDGDVAQMYGVSQETILDDMLGIVEATMR